ncbi:MAG: hypothetical protein GY742_22045, partial [Hyphomicrobiales bacterium]|nr:hypothetical protein [Hyphomicrobiales bacterium]
MSLDNLLIGVQVLDNSWNSNGAPVHASHDVSAVSLIQTALDAGIQIIRLPFDLSTADANGFPIWQLNALEKVLEAASANNIKVIVQPGQTPVDLSGNGKVDGTPANMNDLQELAERFAAGVKQVYDRFGSQYSDTIEGWEIGNEPNMSHEYVPGYVKWDVANNRYWSVSIENGEWYAEYLHATNEAINALGLNIDVNVIAAGIAHNDKAYMEAMFARLDSLDASIDGFNIHPYTTYQSDYLTPESGRPTDWTAQPTGNSESWDYYYGFQEALNNTQYLMNTYGFSSSDLWVTEFGVPSYLGYRNAGEDGLVDQARWYAEALGVFDSLDFTNLKGIMAHHVLDNKSYETNQQYDAYDNDPDNNGTVVTAEAAFCLFHEVNGEIVSKPAALLMNSITSQTDYNYYNIYSTYTQSDIDFSLGVESTTGLTSGYIVLSHNGNDTITGSAFDDSLFAGSGNDLVRGGIGNDRIYGGAGDDQILGENGDDYLTGGKGADIINGGAGLDTAFFSGARSSYGVVTQGANILVTHLESGEVDTVTQVENFQFNDVRLSYTEILNEAPSLTSAMVADINENTAAVMNVTATDPDNGDTPVFSISGGADQN